jgi:orotidine-5'-phosphate decarboxylase
VLKNPVFCAVDRPDLEGALALARTVAPHVGGIKLGLEFFTAQGPRGVAAVQALGLPIFLDLKFHDIPNTVAGAVRSAVRLGARLVTVHASGGLPMLESAQRAASEASDAGCGVLAVTALTSFVPAVLAAAWGRTDALDMEREVLRLAGLAAEAKLHGIVCSGAEVAAVRARFGERLAPLVPGIRLAGGPSHDQARVMTPSAAQSAGARYLILGRAVTAADDPATAMERVLAELRGDG